MTRRMPAETMNSSVAEQTPQTWKKSSLSYSSGDCVEVADDLRGIVRIRNSKDPGGVVLGFSPAGWNVFVGAVHRGRFDPG